MTGIENQQTVPLETVATSTEVVPEINLASFSS
jgi:hypothetical protein